MEAPSLCYLTGEEVHAGDRVMHGTTYGTVVFVSDGALEEFAPGYEEYTGSDRGLILCDDDGNLETLREVDEQLSFVDRG